MKIEKGKIIKNINVIFLKCIYIIITVSILYNILYLLNTTISQNNYFKLFGISLFNMDSDLMQNDINSGDLVIVREVEEKELQTGDIIAYTVNGNIRINKIINKKDEYTTMSNKNYYPDIEKTTYDQVIGKKIVNISGLGFIIEILHSKITSVFIFLFLILCFGYNKYIQKKKIERTRKRDRFFFSSKRDRVLNSAKKEPVPFSAFSG